MGNEISSFHLCILAPNKPSNSAVSQTVQFPCPTILGMRSICNIRRRSTRAACERSQHHQQNGGRGARAVDGGRSSSLWSLRLFSNSFLFSSEEFLSRHSTLRRHIAAPVLPCSRHTRRSRARWQQQPIPSCVWVAADVDKCLQLVPMYWLVAPLLLKKQQLGWRRAAITAAAIERKFGAPPGGGHLEFIIFQNNSFFARRRPRRVCTGRLWFRDQKDLCVTRGALEISQTSNWDLNVVGDFSNSSLHRYLAGPVEHMGTVGIFSNHSFCRKLVSQSTVSFGNIL